jgi:Ca2+-binding RTX toxin-like protein
VSQSTGLAADAVTDFASGTDTLAFTINVGGASAVKIDASTFARVTSFSDGLLSLAGTSNTNGLVYVDGFYDTSAGKIYIDANGDGQINQGNDYTVNLGSVVAGDLKYDITGSSAADTITVGSGDDTIDGGTGVDTITSGGGNDTISNYGAGGDDDVIKLPGTEAIAATASGVNSVTTQTGETYSSNAFGLVTFVADTEVRAAAEWTLVEQKAAVQADSKLSAANKVSIFAAGNDSYIYYAGATTASSDDQFIKITGGSDRKAITVLASDAGITLGAASLSASVTSLAGFLGSEYELHGSAFTHNLLGLNHVSLGGYTEITLNLTAPAVGSVVDAAVDGRTFALLGADTAPAYSATGTARSVTGAATNDLIFGGTGDDTINGAGGGDAIFGGNGTDSLTAGTGNDVISAGAGADTIVMDVNLTAADTIDGGADADTLTFTDSDSATTDLDCVTGVETITLGAVATAVNTVNALVASGDTLTVNGALATTLNWNGAAELDGKFNVTGGVGADTITGGAGADSITGGAGADSMTGGAAADTFTFAAGDTGLPSATNFDVIADYVSSSDVIGYTGGITKFATAVTSASGTAGVTATTGVISFDAADSTASSRLIAVASALGTAGAGNALIYSVGTDSLVYITDGVLGVGANDVLVKLVGITGTSANELVLSSGNITGLQ